MHRNIKHPIILILLFGCLIFLQNLAAQSLSDQIQEFLRNRIESAGTPPKIAIGEEVIHASVVLPLFYERRAYMPAWSDDKGPLPQVDALIRALRKAEHEGLRPDDYHVNKIESTLKVMQQQKSFNPRGLVDLDLLLTDAFLIYGSHLLSGKIDPETIDPKWHANRREADLAQILETALNANRIEEALLDLLPPQDGYKRIKQAFARYRGIAIKGGWPIISGGPKLQRGDCGERVKVLRMRLIATDDFSGKIENNSGLFDDTLRQAVIKFQKRHGLEPDGVVGSATLAALNLSVEERIHRIELNMERWRWLPQDLGERYILVNIANFKLDVVEKSKPILIMRVVVGRPYRRTPVFSDWMTYLVSNPYWHVPHSIATQDVLPLIQKDPYYLSKQKIKVFKGWGIDAQEIDPQTVDWSKVTEKNFSYRLRQEPGLQNALGKIKFMFPNKYNVYLHDTPSKELFAMTERGFSSGCIRIEKPIELAGFVLRGDPKWTQKKILAEIDKGVEQTVKLPQPIPVHLLYWTAWTNEDGSVQFRNDIYERDKLLYQALYEKPPNSPSFNLK